MKAKEILGKKVKDRITGFKGIAIGYAQHYTGCDTVGIKPQELHDGKPIEAIYFDIMRVEILEEKVSEVVPDGQGVG